MKYFLCAVLLLMGLSPATIAKRAAVADDTTTFVNAPPPAGTYDVPDSTVTVIKDKTISQADMRTLDDQSDTPFQSFNFLMAIIVLVFGLITLLFINYKIRNSFLYYKCVLLTLIIVCTIVLVVAGYSNAQITGASGILGGISGYLIGKTSSNEDDSMDKNKKKEPKPTENIHP
jgi:hypothetical protein